MHTFIPPGKRCVFNFNSDLSGNVLIRVSDREIEVPGDDLLGFIANYVRNRRISQLEQATAEEIFQLTKE